ncbi:MAG: hypothetical protein FWD36_00035 [Treponema sp.]|nr:hypothetical protein [Treponema sp.]
MKTGKLYIKLFAVSALVFLTPLLLTCETPIGLGSKISITGPILSITGPTPVSGQKDVQVGSFFTLEGFSTGDTAATRLEIQMTYFDSITSTLVPLGREWRYDRFWQWKKDSDVAWQRYTENDYKDSGLPAPSWVVSGHNVTWSLPIALNGLPKGDYFFTIRAWNATGNSDANSVQKLKAVHDNENPELKITNLNVLRFGTGFFTPEPPEEFDTYVYEPIHNWGATATYISNWINNTLEFGWNIDKPIIGNYSLMIEITNRHNLYTNAGKVLYYRYEWNGAGVLPRYGMFTDRANPPAGYTKVGNAIPVSELVPRDLVTGQPTGATHPENTYVPMQIVVWLKDGNGNEDNVHSKGWFAYWPKTDEPWVHIAFGYKEDPNRETPLNAPNLAFIWSGTTNDRSIAYDNTGLDSLSWKLYKLPENSLEPVNDGVPGSKGSRNNPWEGEVGFPDNGREKHWDFEAKSEFGTGFFKIIVTVKDIPHGKQGVYTAYFSIESNATPTIKNRELLSPSMTDALLGDDDRGNFLIKGIAQIEDSDTIGVNAASVERVTIVWINPQNQNRAMESILEYSDRNYGNWRKVLEEPLTNGYWQDPNGNRIWEVAAIDWVASTDGNNNGNDQEDYYFEKQLNIFTDLDIAPGKNPSGSQTFLIRVQSNEVGGKSLASVERFTPQGDSSDPVLTIDEIVVYKHNSSTGNYEEKIYSSISEDDFEMISTINRNDKMKIKGSWNDNSREKWSGLAPAVLKSYFNDFSITWNGEQINIDMETLPGSYFDVNGKWETGEYVFTDGNTDPIVFLSASITDHNNNRGSKDITLFLETDNPTMIRISSITGDGEYGENKDTNPNVFGIQNYIDIFLEFNKHVQFFENRGAHPYYPPNPLKVPYLELNNGGRAFYFAENGDTRIIFRYFINGIPDPEFLPTAVSGYGGDSSNGRLNVDRIVFSDEYPQTSLVSVDGGTAVIIPVNAVFNPSSLLSLAGGKNLVIDKVPPVIETIVTTAGSLIPHGDGSRIYIMVNFNKTVVIPSAANAENFYLNLKGGNLTEKGAKAIFDNVAGAASITFRYDVEEGHDTSEYGEYLSIDSITIDEFNITDIAWNTFDLDAANNSLPNEGRLNTNLTIDTVAPQIPSITGITANRSYYENTSFNITGLESRNVTVEYCLDYDPSNPENAIWVTVQQSIYPIQGNTTNHYYINNIPLTINGTYHIAARQRDNATKPNVSENPEVANVVESVIVDKGPLLTRLGSSTPDGIYGDGDTIDIDLIFRIPVYLPEQTISGSTASLTMRNMSSGSPIPTAALKSISPDNKTYTFSFTVNGHSTDRLDVASLVMGNLQFYDGPNTSNILVNQWINIANVPADAYGYRLPKSIEIMSGTPERTVIAVNDDEIRITFNRDIYRGDTREKLLIKQIATGYRIPVVLTEERWAELFIGRSDITGFTDVQWRGIGNQLYQRGTNGASVGTGNTLVSDTTIKYVLNYSIDTSDNGMGHISGITPALTYQTLRDSLRTAEALSFYALDKEVEIENITVDGQLRPRLLKVSLANFDDLMIKGATYQWAVPNGFVKDFLETPNGGSISGYDSTMTSGDPENAAHNNNVHRLPVSGIEEPVIRINKGQIEQIIPVGGQRQAHQPLRSEVKIDCRTPGSVMRYRTRQTTDSVGRLIMRNINLTMSANYNYWNWDTLRHPNIPFLLPHLGTQQQNQGGIDSFERTKRRPQSGNISAPLVSGTYANDEMNYWVPMGNWPEWINLAPNYTAPFTIGTGSYNDGGMEIHIHAQSRRADAGNWEDVVYAYEAAYRSVFAFNNTNLNNNNCNRNIASGSGAATVLPGNPPTFTENTSASYSGNPDIAIRARMYIRGGDSTSGEPSIPDFPIARDRSLSRKARLMTPLSIPGNSALGNSANGYSNFIDNSFIPASYQSHGHYLWVWVTWGVNVYAYIDFFSGLMHQTESYHTETKDFYGAFIPSKEHYPVIPGRTTVVETRGAYNLQADGGHAPFPYLGPPVLSPAPTDR